MFPSHRPSAVHQSGGPRPRQGFPVRAIASEPSPDERRRKGWLPRAPPAPQGFVAGLPRVPRALAARPPRGRRAGQGRREAQGRQPSSCAQTQGAAVSDPEIEDLRDKVHCAVVLERTPPSWTLDRKESTKLSLKYRR